MIRRAPVILTLATTLASFAACTLDWDKLDPSLGTTTAGGGGVGGAGLGGSGGTGGTGGTGGIGGSGGDGGFGTGGMGGTSGGMGGGAEGGGEPTSLVGDGLVVRYFLDEAASGQGPAAMLDAAPNPLNLPLTYSVGMAYVDTATGRGIAWPTAGADGGAWVSAAGTKVEAAIVGNTQATIEVVADVLGAHPSGSRFTHVGADFESVFSVELEAGGQINFDASLMGESTVFPLAFTSLGRAVYHVVIDTNAAQAIDRARLLVDGVPVAGMVETPLALGQTFTFLPASFFAVGNRDIGVRSIAGTLYYAAIYDRALTSAEIAQNVTILDASDDPPP